MKVCLFWRVGPPYSPAKVWAIILLSYSIINIRIIQLEYNSCTNAYYNYLPVNTLITGNFGGRLKYSSKVSPNLKGGTVISPNIDPFIFNSK